MNGYSENKKARGGEPQAPEKREIVNAWKIYRRQPRPVNDFAPL